MLKGDDCCHVFGRKQEAAARPGPRSPQATGRLQLHAAGPTRGCVEEATYLTQRL